MRPQFGASRDWLHQLACQLLKVFGNVRPGLGSWAAQGAIGAMLVVSSGGCENQSIGRTCKTLATGTTETQAVFNDEALECPTRLCIKPAYQQGTVQAGTLPFCTAECGKNSDCSDAETRDQKNPADKRCTKGFVCATPFEVGPLKCKKMCVCGDFVDVSKSTKIPVPAACAAP